MANIDLFADCDQAMAKALLQPHVVEISRHLIAVSVLDGRVADIFTNDSSGVAALYAFLLLEFRKYNLTAAYHFHRVLLELGLINVDKMLNATNKINYFIIINNLNKIAADKIISRL